MSEVAKTIRLSSRAGTTLGIATILFGLVAMAVPSVSGQTVALVVGLLLIAGGIARGIFAFKTGSFGRGLLTFLFGGLSVLCGLVMLARPLLGLASLTMVLALYFFADGILEVVAGLTIKGQKGWLGLILGGIASTVFGILIWRQWPASGLWAIGILVGLRLMMAGSALIALGAIGERLADEADRMGAAVDGGGELTAE